MSEQQVQEKEIKERSSQRGARGITGALILIAIGVAVLLSNLDIVSFNWLVLLQYWPVFLIIVGLDLMLSRSALGTVAVAIIGLIMLGGVLYFASTQPGPSWLPFAPISGNTITREVSEDLGDVDEIDQVTFRLGAFSAEIDSTSSADNVVSGTYTTDEEIELIVDYTSRGSTGTLHIEQQERTGNSYIGELDISLSEAVPIRRVVVNAGVGDLRLNLSQLDITDEVVIEGGVGAITVILPESGSYDVSIRAGIGDIDVTILSEMEARLELNTGLTNVDVPSRFERLDSGEFETNGYSGAGESVLIQIDTGIGNVEIH